MIFKVKELKKGYNFYKKNGYIIIEDDIFSKIKKKIEGEIFGIYLSLSKSNKKINLKNIVNYKSLLKYLIPLDSKLKLISILYDLCPANPYISTLHNQEIFLKIIKQLRIKKPLLGTMTGVRFDRPNDEKRNTAIHQDQWYSFLSDNALTIWFNLDVMEKSLGPLIVYPKTHLKKIYNFIDNNKGTFDIRKKNLLPKEMEIKLQKNQILIFNQYLLHKSGNNVSDKPRVSLQIRYNDLSTQKKFKSSFRCITSQHVLDNQQKYLKLN